MKFMEWRVAGDETREVGISQGMESNVIDITQRCRKPLCRIDYKEVKTRGRESR